VKIPFLVDDRPSTGSEIDSDFFPICLSVRLLQSMRLDNFKIKIPCCNLADVDVAALCFDLMRHRSAMTDVSLLMRLNHLA
jgi:hypothetical protein